MGKRADVMIVTALSDELTPVRERFNAERVPASSEDGIYRYYSARVDMRDLGTLRIILGSARAKGPQPMTAFLAHAFRRWTPRHVFLVGVAAAVPEGGAELTDVMVATAIVDLGEIKLRPQLSKSTVRRKVRDCDHDLLHPIDSYLDTFRSAEGNAAERLPAKLGIVLSQPNLVKTAEVRSWLADPVWEFFDEWPIALEMEGGGLCDAVRSEPRETRPAFILVKAAVDYANFFKNDAARVAAKARAADFVAAFLEAGSLPVPPDRRERRSTGQPGATTGTRPLFGRQAEIDLLAALLRDLQRPPIVVVDGVGGIGKTALAEHVSAAVQADRFDRSARYTIENRAEGSGRPSPLGAFVSRVAVQLGYTELESLATPRAASELLARLERERVLLFIDNVEQGGSLTEIAPYLDQIPRSASSRVLVTSRPRLNGLFADLAPVRLEELDESDAISVLQRALEEAAIPPTAVSKSQMQTAFSVVGGNPQALRVVAGLFASYPPNVVLRMISRGRGDAEHMYRDVYLSAWLALSPPARSLMMGLAEGPVDGVTSERLQAVSGVDDDTYADALAEAVGQNLLAFSVRGGTPLYSMHQLTRTFIENVVAEWDTAALEEERVQARRRSIGLTLRLLGQTGDG